jgi:hypothetical protein
MPSPPPASGGMRRTSAPRASSRVCRLGSKGPLGPAAPGAVSCIGQLIRPARECSTVHPVLVIDSVGVEVNRKENGVG